jgi:serine/threonine protein kinase
VIGQSLGRYTITAPIGAGGMGAVYRATDQTLGREVAIKVLPREVAQDADRLSRFEREAKAVAALSHPNILAIHDFGQASTASHEPITYAVMELLEGESLRHALESGALSPRRAAEYGRQIAEGLAAAHGKGIVHRDLKPENLFITRDGLIKILDFGLARQIVSSKPGTETTSPTIVRGTEPGIVMGTVGYMAPEQVRGEGVDHRADIFSFGVVLYEMLAGRRAFERTTGAETMTAILREDAASLSSVREGIPLALERVVDHCLEKRPDDRFQSARDLAFALGASSGSGRTAATTSPDAVPRRRSSPAAIATGALLLGAFGGALGYRQLASRTVAAQPPTARYLTYSGRDFSPATSPDGHSIAFRSDRDGRGRIWLKQLATGTEVALTEGPLDDMPQFSPDGSTVLFTRKAGARLSLFRAPLLGGGTRRVVDDAMDGAWSPDGRQIVYVHLDPASPGKIASSSLIIAGSDGTAPRALIRLEASGIQGPRWSPDNKKIAMVVTAVGAASFSLRLVDVASGAMETIVERQAASRPWIAQWTPDGRLVYTSGGITAGSLAGTMGRIMSLDPRTKQSSLLYGSPDSLGALALVDGRRLVVETQVSRQNVTEWTGTMSRSVSVGRAADRQPVYSPDGQWIVFSSDRSGNLDLWAVSTTSGELRQLTDDSSNDWDPAFAPDGRLLWSSNRSGNFEVWTAAADGSGARQLSHDGVDAENPAASPDGKWIVYGSTRPNQAGIWRMRADGSDATLLAPGLIGIPDISPDGQYVLYLGFTGNLVGTGVRVVRLVDGEPTNFEIRALTIRPTTANIGRARWMPKGLALAFVGQDEKGVNGIFEQQFAADRDTLVTRRKLAAFDTKVDAETFAVSPDGRRIAVAGRELVSSLVLLDGVRR